MSTLTKQDIFERLLDAIPSGFDKLRGHAKSSYFAQGLPAPKAEEYKFTNIAKRLDQEFDSFEAASPFDLSDELVKSAIFKGFDGNVLVFANGIYNPSFSSPPEKIEISLLSQKEDTALGTIAKPEKDSFCALNQASFVDGIFVSIPKKLQVKKPILLLFFNQENKGNTIQPRIWIEAGDFAEVTFIDLSINLSQKPYFVNKVVEIKGAVNSHIYYNRLQHEGPNAFEVSTIETDIQQYARLSATTISLTGGMIRNNLNLNLLGGSSEGNMYGLYLLNGKTHVDNHTNVDHTIPHAESNELYKGILDDQSRGVFNGKIFVRQDAQKTNAFQQNNNILLSEDALINTKPQLEIWADDVKCSHGCTTGQLDEDALFYLQARGIGKDQAKGFLLYAFAGEVLEKIEEASFRAFCTELVQARLGSKL